MGYSGTGVLPTVTLGRCLASTVLELDDEFAAMATLLGRRGSRFPPEPIRYAAGRLVQRAIQKKESAEELGRLPPRVVTALTEAFMPDGTHLAPPTLSSFRKALRSRS
jgi:hypothetical protein